LIFDIILKYAIIINIFSSFYILLVATDHGGLLVYKSVPTVKGGFFMFLVRFQYFDGSVKYFKVGPNYAAVKSFIEGVVGQSHKLKQQLDPDGSLGIFAPVKRYVIRKKAGKFIGFSQVRFQEDGMNLSRGLHRKHGDVKEKESRQIECRIYGDGSHFSQVEAV